ncbi:hypothetical protein CDD83_7902 [Cordyceps sp. RAO-2017]|nr:hypothetical protein CDD83_7902 [Cordyceps sp. RAO-2017]
MGHLRLEYRGLESTFFISSLAQFMAFTLRPLFSSAQHHQTTTRTPCFDAISERKAAGLYDSVDSGGKAMGKTAGRKNRAPVEIILLIADNLPDMAKSFPPRLAAPYNMCCEIHPGRPDEVNPR